MSISGAKHFTIARSWRCVVFALACMSACGKPAVDDPQASEFVGSAESQTGEAVENEQFAWSPTGTPSEPPVGTEPGRKRAMDIGCEGDPFSEYLVCRGACHFVVGQITEVEDVALGFAMEKSTKFVAADIRTAQLAVEQKLTDTKSFEYGSLIVNELPGDVISVEEYPHGSYHYYEKGITEQVYIGSDWSTEIVVPPHAEFEEGEMLLVGLKTSHNIAALEERYLVTFVAPVVNGEVDFSMFEGTGYNEWDRDELMEVPVGKVSVAEAGKFLRWMTENNIGLRCTSGDDYLDVEYEDKQP